MKYLLASLALLSLACGGAAHPRRAANPNNEIPRPAKTPVKFGALPPLPDEGPLAERPTRMLKALQAKGYAAVLQKDKSVLVTTEKFGVVVPTSTAHLCQFDLPFLSAKGITDETSLVARITAPTESNPGINFTVLPEGSRFRVTARFAVVVQKETECAELAAVMISDLLRLVDQFEDVYGVPAFPGGSSHPDQRTGETTIHLSGINARVRAHLKDNTQGYRDYYHAMLDSEGTAPTVDREGHLLVSYNQLSPLYLLVPEKISFPDAFILVFQGNEPAAEVSVPMTQAACMDAMASNVFIRCTTTVESGRTFLRISSTALFSGSSDPRYNFRNGANAVRHASVQVSNYLHSHR